MPCPERRRLMIALPPGPLRLPPRFRKSAATGFTAQPIPTHPRFDPLDALIGLPVNDALGRTRKLSQLAGPFPPKALRSPFRRIPVQTRRSDPTYLGTVAGVPDRPEGQSFRPADPGCLPSPKTWTPPWSRPCRPSLAGPEDPASDGQLSLWPFDPKIMRPRSRGTRRCPVSGRAVRRISRHPEAA